MTELEPEEGTTEHTIAPEPKQLEESHQGCEPATPSIVVGDASLRGWKRASPTATDIAWQHRGPSGNLLRLGVMILGLRLQLQSMLDHLDRPSRILHLRSSGPQLQHGPSALRTRRAPSARQLHLGQTSPRLRCGLSGHALLSGLPPLRLRKAPPSLRLHFCPRSHRLVLKPQDPHLHLRRSCCFVAAILVISVPSLLQTFICAPGSTLLRHHRCRSAL